MIEYVTRHDLGRKTYGLPRYILKYFDPFNPTCHLTARYVATENKNNIPAQACLIREKDQQLFDWTRPQLTVDMRAVCREVMFDPRSFYLWEDMWNDIGFTDLPQIFGDQIDHRKLLLFAFWHSYNLGWDKRLFKECYPIQE